MKRILFYGLILSVIILNACSGEKRDDGSTEVKIIMNGEFNRVPEGINKSEQKVSQYTYNLLLKITAPDLSEPLIFLNPDYQPGTQWTVLVPNGTARTFELIEYTVFDSISYNYFNFSMYIPSNPPEERTYDLTGSPIDVAIPLTYSETGYLSSGSGGGWLLGMPPAKSPGISVSSAITYPGLIMKTPSGDVYVPNCYGIVLRAFLVDPEFPGLVLGPALLDMETPRFPGEYSLGGIPVNRTYQVIVTNPESGWQGSSDFFTLPNQPSSELHRSIILTGYQPLEIVPNNFPVKDGDTTFKQTLDIKGGWIKGYFSIWNDQFSYGSVSWGDTHRTKIDYYASPGGLGDGGTDIVHVEDSCDYSQATAKAWWYKAPKISSISPDPICPDGGDIIYIYSTDFNFDIITYDSIYSEIFLDGTYYHTLGGDRSGIDYIWFNAPRKPAGFYTLKVRNKRTNPKLPNFEGWADSIRVEYNKSGCGGMW